MHPVGDLLPEDQPLILPPRTTVFEACIAMRDAHVGAVLIGEHDRAGPVLGIFTERDLMTRIVAAEKDPARVTLEDAMSRDVYITRPDVPTSEVRREMQRRHIRHAPVLDEENGVIAVLSLRDLLKADLRDTRNEVKEITQYIQGGYDSPR